MSSSKCASILILLTGALTAASQSANSQARASLSCDRATMTKPQVGVAYSGDITIDDYKLHVRIPEGLTGWSGVAADAPFHGFTIFLDPSMRNCIVFEVHLRIDEDEVPVRPHVAKLLLLGNVTAWQVSSNNRAKGPINITTYFSFRQDSQIDDGKIILISRPDELQRTRSIYETFLKSVVLGAPHSR